MTPEDRKDWKPESEAKTVYLAEVSPEMVWHKENLAAELKHQNCTLRIIDAKDISQENIRQTIDGCDLSVHILSKNDKEIIQGDKGIEESQIHISTQYHLSQRLISQSSDDIFEILAWYPRTNAIDIYGVEKLPKHLTKIQQLEEVELLRTGFEEFKSYIFKKLESDPIEEIDEFYIKGDDSLNIYFLYDGVDQPYVNDYIELLNNRGYTVFTPQFDENILAVRHAHNTSLKQFDIAIIFSKDSNVNWINMKIMDIMKSPGLGRNKPIKGKSILCTTEKLTKLPMAKQGFHHVSSDQFSCKEQIDQVVQNAKS